MYPVPVSTTVKKKKFDHAAFMADAGVKFATASYRNYQPWMGLPIRTTAYAPRYRLPYELHGSIPELAPARSWLELDRETFEPLYQAKVDEELGPYPYLRFWEIARELRLATGGPGKRVKPRARLVMLCFCDLEKTWCHRQLISGWFFRSVGVDCPELTPRGE